MTPHKCFQHMRDCLIKKNLLHNKSVIQTVQQQEEKSVQNTGKEATINCLSSWGSLDNSDSLKTVWSASTSQADQRHLTRHMTWWCSSSAKMQCSFSPSAHPADPWTPALAPEQRPSGRRWQWEEGISQSQSFSTGGSMYLQSAGDVTILPQEKKSHYMK